MMERCVQKKVGILGCGAIGTETAKALCSEFKEKAVLHAICDTDSTAVRLFYDNIGRKIQVLEIDELCKQVDMVVEAASSDIVPELIRLAEKHSADVLVMSVGGLLGEEEHIANLKRKGLHLYIPSGAVSGLDALKAGMMGQVDVVQLTTKKPVEGLRGAPYLEENGIDLDSIMDQQVIFEGNACEAIRAFPKNINVAATVSLAGIGLDKTQVKVLVSPKFRRNSHELYVKGSFGTLRCITENVPSPSNPKTSYLAALSCMAILRKVLEGMEIGT